MPLELTLPSRGAPWAAVPSAWRLPLIQLGCAWAGLMLLAAADWAEMARQWWNASTYNHILLIPPILAWLVHARWAELTKLVPAAWWPGLVWALAGLLASLAGAAGDINLVKQAGAVAMLQAAVMTVLGPRVAWGLLFPLGYMAFLVPFGDEIVPALQTVTARMGVALTHASGVPAHLNGVFIDTPVGLFEVAEACSGVKFLVAMLALGTLAAHLGFLSWKRRAVFMTAAAVVPVLANGVRAWGTIYVAQSRGVEFAAGFDHILYGWIFFALVMAVLLGVAWQCFDRPASDPLLDAVELENSPLLGRLAQHRLPGWCGVAALLLIGTAGLALGSEIEPHGHALLAAASGRP